MEASGAIEVLEANGESRKSRGFKDEMFLIFR
jgi:hypothetical protein